MEKAGIIKRKIAYGVALIAILLMSLNSNSLRVKAADPDYVYFTIEKFVIGQRYLLEPTKIAIENDENVTSVLTRLADQEGIALMRRNTSYGLYLYGIKSADSGENDIPSKILKNYSEDLQEYLVDGDLVNHALEKNALEELGYTPYSGWLYFVNDQWQYTGMDSRILSSGDVVRLKYTVVEGDSGWAMDGSAQISLPDESEVIRILADLKESLKKKPDDDLQNIYNNAILIISDLDTSAMNIDSLTDRMKELNNAILDNDKEKINEIMMYVQSLLDEVQANDVSQKIDLIPDVVTSDVKYTVKRALTAYEKLNENTRNKLSEDSYNKLIKGENQLIQLEEQEEQKKLQDEANKVIEKINSIKTVTLDKENMIIEARKAYNTLDTDARGLIASSIYKKLTDAEAALMKLKETEQTKKTTQQKKAKTVANYKPAKTTLKYVKKAGKGKTKLSWRKISKASGYIIYMSMKKNKGYKKIATIKKQSVITYTKPKLKKGKKYYFKIKVYTKVKGKNYYSGFSNIKSIKIKK